MAVFVRPMHGGTRRLVPSATRSSAAGASARYEQCRPDTTGTASTGPPDHPVTALPLRPLHHERPGSAGGRRRRCRGVRIARSTVSVVADAGVRA